MANAGLILAGTLMARLGLSGLIERWVRTGSANPGPKICTVVAAMLAGGTHIDHVGMLRAGRTGRVLGFRPMAPSTVGTLRRTFTFGHVRQLEAVLSRTLARAWQLGAGPGRAPLVVDLDSTICEVHGKQKQGAAYGYTKELGYHPLLAARADTGEVLGARMRKGSAGSSRGVERFVDELAANLRRAGAAGPTTVRGDSGFWSRKLIDRLDAHNIKWSITVTLGSAVRAAIQAIPSTAWTDIAYTKDGHAQVAETQYTTRLARPRQSQAHRPPRRPRRTRPLTDCAPLAASATTLADAPHAQPVPRPTRRRLATPHAFIRSPTPNTTPPPPTSSTAPTPSSSSPSATSKKAPGSSTSPQATTGRTAHRSHAPCSLLPGLPGDPQHRPPDHRQAAARARAKRPQPPHGIVEAIRQLSVTRNSAVKARSAAPDPICSSLLPPRCASSSTPAGPKGRRVRSVAARHRPPRRSRRSPSSARPTSSAAGSTGWSPPQHPQPCHASGAALTTPRPCSSPRANIDRLLRRRSLICAQPRRSPHPAGDPASPSTSQATAQPTEPCT